MTAFTQEQRIALADAISSLDRRARHMDTTDPDGARRSKQLHESAVILAKMVGSDYGLVEVSS